MKQLLIILFSILFLSGCGTSSFIDIDKPDYEFDDSNIYDYAKNNYTIDDLFDQDTIKDYVRDNYEIYDIYDTDSILEYVRDNYEPEEVYPNLDYDPETR